jgi:hypothetical protein
MRTVDALTETILSQTTSKGSLGTKSARTC